MISKAKVQQWLSKRINKPFKLEYWHMSDIQPGLGAWYVETSDVDFSLDKLDKVRDEWDNEFKRARKW